MTPVTMLSGLAKQLILDPAGLELSQLERALGIVHASQVDAADLYFQFSRDEGWSLEDGIVKEGSAAIEQGVGVRASSGEKTGFAYSDEILPAALEGGGARCTGDCSLGQ